MDSKHEIFDFISESTIFPKFMWKLIILGFLISFYQRCYFIVLNFYRCIILVSGVYLLKFYVLHKWDYFQLILQIKAHYSRICFSHSLSSHRAKFPRLLMHRSCQGSDVVGESVFSKPGLGLILYSCNNNTAGWRIAWVTAFSVKNFSPIIHEEFFNGFKTNYVRVKLFNKTT